MKQVAFWLYENLLEWTVGVILAVIVFLSVLQVFNRYVLANPLGWSEELVRLLLVWSVFLGAAAGIKHRMHLRVDLLFDQYSGQFGRVMIVLINLVMMGVAVSMSKYGVDFYLSTANDYSTSLGYARNMFYLPIPVSGVLMIFFLSINIVRDWKYHDQPGLHKKA